MFECRKHFTVSEKREWTSNRGPELKQKIEMNECRPGCVDFVLCSFLSVTIMANAEEYGSKRFPTEQQRLQWLTAR